MTVWKYLLHVASQQFIDIPIDAKPVLLDTQDNQICLWAELDPTQEKTQRKIFCVSTGGNVPENTTHIGSVVLPDTTVWHYYW